MARRKWIDVTVTLKSGMVQWPTDPRVLVDRRRQIAKGDANNVSVLSMCAHTGTHMDAPCHYLPRGKSLDRMPLCAVIGRARVVAIKDRRCVGVNELLPLRIRRGERILFKTANSAYWRREKFVHDFVHIAPAAADFLAARGVRCVGIDYLSVGAYGDGIATHRALLSAGVWIIEGLDLSHVKPGEYDLICLPLKILDADGAPVRAVLAAR